jgi:hypothetical protein
MAALIREAVDRVHPTDDTVSREARWRRALAAMGSARGLDGVTNAATDHDRYLDEAYADWTEK